jgi:hypothetical protein
VSVNAGSIAPERATTDDALALDHHYHEAAHDRKAMAEVVFCLKAETFT